MTKESRYPEVGQVMRELKLERPQLLQDGPRYVVASTRHEGRPALFKMMVPGAKNPVPPEDEGIWFPGLAGDMRKEAALLEFLSEYRAQITGNVPLLLNYSDEPGRLWYVRELLKGSPMAGPDMPFVFPRTYYELVAPGELVAYFASLQALTTKVTPKLAERLQIRYPRPEMTRRMVDALDGRWSHPAVRRSADRTRRWLEAAEPLLRRSPPVIAHNEPFASHIFLENGRIGLIDWESSSWGHRLHDFSRLWVRFFDDDEYRARFESELTAAGYLSTADDLEAWDITRMVQGVASLNYYHNNHVLPPESEQKLYSMLARELTEIAERHS